jgi:hypothetical protein
MTPQQPMGEPRVSLDRRAFAGSHVHAESVLKAGGEFQEALTR